MSPPAREAGRRDERGIALPLVLVILIILGLVGAASAFMTVGDARVSQLYSSANRASAAAAAGLERAVVDYHERLSLYPGGATSIDDWLLGLSWPITGTIDGYDYRVEIARDSFDYDGDGEVGPVSYRGKGAGNPFNEKGQGTPVHRLVSTATRGDHRSTQTLVVTKNVADPHLSAGLTLNTYQEVRLFHDYALSGVNSAMETGVGIDSLDSSYKGDACAENKPALHLTKPHHVKGESGPGEELVVKDKRGQLSGNLSFKDDDPPYILIDNADTRKWETVEDILGLGAGELDGYQKSPAEWNASLPDSLSGITYITGDVATGTSGCLSKIGCGNIQGRGILIIHNPLYNPREHDPSDPLYDSAKAKSLTYAPASMGNIRGGTFRGIVLVDALARMDSGPFQIYGAVVMLAHENHSGRTWLHYNHGTGTIKYSCEAITHASHQFGPKRLAWTSE